MRIAIWFALGGIHQRIGGLKLRKKRMKKKLLKVENRCRRIFGAAPVPLEPLYWNAYAASMKRGF